MSDMNVPLWTVHMTNLTSPHLTSSDLVSADLISLYPPSERSESGGYTAFTFVCLRVCLCALSAVFNSVLNEDWTECALSLTKITWRIYALSERLLV